MRCPACGRELVTQKVAEITVDACAGGCGGIWFDQGELQQLDHAAAAAGRSLLDLPRDPLNRVDGSARRKCPRCTGVVMMRHVYGPEADVHVDQCAGCGGFWLDAGELAAIRAQFETAARRELAFERNFNVEIGVELALAAAREARRRQTLAELGGIFRFIFPPSSRRRRR